MGHERARAALLAGALGGLLAGCIEEHRYYYGAPGSGGAPAAPAPPPPERYSGEERPGPRSRFVLLVGGRWFDETWAPFDDQFAFQFGSTYEWPRAPVGVEWALGFSDRTKDFDGARFQNSNFEASVGVTRTLRFGQSRWFTNLGAGLAWLYTWEGEQLDCCFGLGTDDNWFAGYAHGGVFYQFSPAFDLGLDLRYLKGQDPKLSGFVLEGEYWQLALGFGFGI